MSDAPRPIPDPVRAALEEARNRPLPPPEEVERLMPMLEEAMKGPFMSSEEFLAEVAAMRPAAE
jgi:hypothetical protein